MFSKVFIGVGIAAPLIAFVVSLLLIFGVITLYFVLERFFRKKSLTTYRAVFLTILVLAFVIFRLIIIGIIIESKGDVGFWNGVGQAFKYLYASLGTLTFEGQPDSIEGISDEMVTLYVCSYHISSIVVASSFAAIVTLNISYGFHSRVKYNFINFFHVYKKYFIFTSITEDTLRLADSIVEKTDKDSVIIFTANKSDNFDRDNPLHRRARVNLYYFIKCRDDLDQKNQISILNILHIKHNIAKEIHFFSMNTSEKQTGLEANNADIVFDEIKALKKRGLVNLLKMTKFYILTNNDISYEPYSYLLERENANYANINLISEAELSGRSLIKERLPMERRRIKRSGLINGCGPSTKPKKDEYVAYILGFGQTGKAALNNLFIDSSNMYGDEQAFISQRFVAHVYDKNIDGSAASYIKNHPSMIFKDDKHEALINEDELITAYGEEDFKEMDRRIKFPHIYLHGKNIMEAALFEKQKNDEDMFNCYKEIDSIVVALGNDEANIEAANMLIQEMRRLCFVKKQPLHIDIFVNIFDCRNKGRLLLLEKITNPELFDEIRVIEFGHNDQLYSYDTILSFAEAIKMNDVYEGKPGDEAENEQSVIEKDIYRLMREEEKKYPHFEPTYLWEKSYKLVSSNYSALFAEYFYHYLRANNKFFTMINNSYEAALGEINIQYLAELEHLRWCRFMIVYGSIYGEVKVNAENVGDIMKNCTLEEKIQIKKDYYKNIVKVHNCMVPYSVLPDYLEKYDYYNVILGSLLIYHKEERAAKHK